MKQTITSKYEPKSKNVTWLCMSSGSPVQKNFINGMWRPTGGRAVAGVKIPIPTAEDEGKILIVTKTEGNAFTIVPELLIPADVETPLTDIDLTKFIVGNTVKVTFISEGQLTVKTGVIEEREGVPGVLLDIFQVWQIDNLLYTNAGMAYDSNSIMKLEYIEPNYEYQLQELKNSDGGASSLPPTSEWI